MLWIDYWITHLIFCEWHSWLDNRTSLVIRKRLQYFLGVLVWWFRLWVCSDCWSLLGRNVGVGSAHHEVLIKGKFGRHLNLAYLIGVPLLRYLQRPWTKLCGYNLLVLILRMTTSTRESFVEFILPIYRFKVHHILGLFHGWSRLLQFSARFELPVDVFALMLVRLLALLVGMWNDKTNQTNSIGSTLLKSRSRWLRWIQAVIGRLKSLDQSLVALTPVISGRCLLALVLLQMLVVKRLIIFNQFEGICRWLSDFEGFVGGSCNLIGGITDTHWRIRLSYLYFYDSTMRIRLRSL